MTFGIRFRILRNRRCSIAVVKSMHTDQFNHAPAQLFVHTGSQIQGRPSMGSWVTYGLGTENSDLPGFVVLVSGPNNPDGGASLGVFEGTQFRSLGQPGHYVYNPSGVAEPMSEAFRCPAPSEDSELSGTGIRMQAIEQYELAYRMQTTVPELSDISKEPQAIHEMYGQIGSEGELRQHLPALPPLVASSVRFVQL